MECILLKELELMTEEQIRAYDCIIVDEVQFATKEQIDFLSDIVDFMEVPVVCYGPVSYTHLDVYKRQGWTFPATPQDAIDGVYSGEYYAALIMEEDFSQSMYDLSLIHI